MIKTVRLYSNLDCFWCNRNSSSVYMDYDNEVVFLYTGEEEVHIPFEDIVTMYKAIEEEV